MELTFPQIPNKIPTRDKKGRIIAGSGHIPANKGKKWGEYNVPEESRKKILANFSNNADRLKGALAKKERYSQKVIGIKDRKFFGEFDSAADAARDLQAIGIKVCSENIRTCCKGKRTSAGGVKWFYERDFDKWNSEIKAAV